MVRSIGGGKFRLYSHTGKNLGTFSSKSAALKHERQIQYFKHAKETNMKSHKGSGEKDIVIGAAVIAAGVAGYFAWMKWGPVPTTATITLAPGAMSVRVNGNLTVNLPTGGTWGSNTGIVGTGSAPVTVATSTIIPTGTTSSPFPLNWTDSTGASQTTTLTVTTV